MNATLKQIRAFVIWPKAYCALNNQEVKILSAAATSMLSDRKPGSIIIKEQRILVATKDFYIEIFNLQFPNKKPCSAHDAICGYKDKLDLFS